MKPLRLRMQLLLATLPIIAALTGASLLVFRHTVRAEIDKQVRESTVESVRAFESVQKQRGLQLSRTAAILAELPTMKALMTTEHAPTIQDGSEPVWKLAGSDLLVLARPDRQVVALHMAKPGWSLVMAERDLKRSLEQGEDASWWYDNGRLYWVFLRPIVAGDENNRVQLGFLAVGYQVDSSVAQQLAQEAGSQIALATSETVIASTLPAATETELGRHLGREDLRPDSGTHEMDLGQERYEVASVLLHGGLPTPVQCHVLMALGPVNGFIQRLNRMIFVLGASAVVFAAFLFSFFARRITRPLDNLVAGVRALAAGDYTYSITPRGSSEVAELGSAFSKMRGELLASQKQRIETERIAALGRAASSISHDLRHSLAAVVANAEFLYEADSLKLDKSEIYQEIKIAAEQMTDLIDSLREMAHEQRALSPVSAGMDQTVRRAIEAVRTRPELRNRTISLHTTGEMEGMFDPKKLERAFFNLLLNACEATEGAEGRIQVEIAAENGNFEIRVADNGPGIPDAIRATLFDPFVSHGKPNGTGLGLAIVSKIIHDHGGSVRVEKTAETGTIILVTLPRSVRAMDAETAPSVT